MRPEYIDFHCHILPGMDFDGTDDFSVSTSIYKTLREQGVAMICATPHFYPWNEDVDAFIERRRRVLDALPRIDAADIHVGAEVRVFRELYNYPVNRMCIGSSNVILLEMPDEKFDDWMISAIENAVLRFSLVPVIAHIERYGYSHSEFEKLAGIPRVVFQFTVSSIYNSHYFNAMQTAASMGVPVVFGSDAHNMSSRPPHFDYLGDIMGRKAKFFEVNLKKRQAIVCKCLHGQNILNHMITEPKKANVE